MANLLLLAGFAGVGVWAWSVVRRDVFQSRESLAFDGQTRAAPPRSSTAPRPEPGASLGRLLIPRLHLRAMVREGTGDDTLDVALGHVPGTALPGQTGNVAVAGHRDTLFRCLRNISKDDQIVFQTAHGSYTYHVQRTAIVTPRDVGVLDAGSYPEITLITCYPFHYVGPAPERFIVTARLDDPSPGKKLLSPRIADFASHSRKRLPDE